MNAVDKPGWSFLKETRADSCIVEPSLVEDVVFNPNCCVVAQKIQINNNNNR